MATVRDQAGKPLLSRWVAVFSHVTSAVVVIPMSFKRLWIVSSLSLLLGSVAHAGGEYIGERNTFNRFHGHGVYSYTNGSVYEGQWVDGRKQGQGKQMQPDGSVYTGDWRDNQQHGQGRMRWVNGDSYDGQWSDGHMHGKGVFVSANGDRYEGSFVVNQRDGAGVLTRRNGERFEGHWKTGAREGKGILTKPGLGVIAGQWSNDTLDGDATVTFSNGERFVGALQNELPHGKGTCKSKAASAACEFKEGKRLVAEVKPAAKLEVKPAQVANIESGVNATGAVFTRTIVTKSAQTPAEMPAGSGSALQAGRSHIDKPVSGPTKPPSMADIIRRTAAIDSVNSAPAAAAGIAPKSVALQTQAPQFSFLHDWEGATSKNNSLPVIYAAKDSINFGDVKIRAEGGDVAVTLVVDEYAGPGIYPLKYFKASIAKEGVASYQTAAAEPGELHVTYDDGNVMKGTFRFVAYRNGNPATQEKKSVSEGLFVVPVKTPAQSGQK